MSESESRTQPSSTHCHLTLKALACHLKTVIILLVSVTVLFFLTQTQTRFFNRPESPYPTCCSISTSNSNTLIFNHSEPITNISHIVFGIGSSANSWKLRQKYTELWWRANLTRGFVWLDEKPVCNYSGPPYRVSSKEWRRFKHSSSPSAVRISRILVDLIRVGLPDVRWFVLGDDDTVFFGENLVWVLGRYDHRQMYYIGGNSESVEQDVMHSYGTAFGGGGIALSYPLAVVLARKLDGCLQRYHYLYGSDERISNCVAEIGVSLTIEPGFHQRRQLFAAASIMPLNLHGENIFDEVQIDLRRDIYGFLAAHPMAPLVSLHHLDYVDPIFPHQDRLESINLLIKAATIDPLRTLQPAFTPYNNNNHQKWSISISWGYTIQLYPYPVYPNELRLPLQTFQTWRTWSNGPFTFNTRPVKTDPCQKPLIYFFERVQGVGDDDQDHNLTLSTYRLYFQEQVEKCDRADYSRAMELKSIDVVAAKMNPQQYWNKMETRREDCVIIESMKTTSMTLRIGTSSFQV